MEKVKLHCTEEVLQIQLDQRVGQVQQQLFKRRQHGTSTRKILRHMRFDKSSGKYVYCWSSRKQKYLSVQVKVYRDRYQNLSGEQAPGKETHASEYLSIADTGASVCCSGVEMLKSLGVKESELIQTEVNLMQLTGGRSMC